MSIKDIKAICSELGVSTSTLLEKEELINALNARQTRRALPRECLARFAIRIAWMDRKVKTCSGNGMQFHKLLTLDSCTSSATCRPWRISGDCFAFFVWVLFAALC